MKAIHTDIAKMFFDSDSDSGYDFEDHFYEVENEITDVPLIQNEVFMEDDVELADLAALQEMEAMEEDTYVGSWKLLTEGELGKIRY